MLLFSSLSILSITYKCTIKYWRFQSTKRSSQKLTGLYTFKQFLNCCFSFRTSFFHPASSEHAAPCVFFFLYKQNSFPIKMKKMKSDRLFFLAMDFCCCFRLVSLFSWRDGDFVLREIFSVVFWQEGKTTLCHWMLLVALLWQKRETPLQKQNQIWTGINCLWLSGICIVKSTDGVLLFSYLSKTLFFFSPTWNWTVIWTPLIPAPTGGPDNWNQNPKESLWQWMTQSHTVIGMSKPRVAGNWQAV